MRCLRGGWLQVSSSRKAPRVSELWAGPGERTYASYRYKKTQKHSVALWHGYLEQQQKKVGRTCLSAVLC